MLGGDQPTAVPYTVPGPGAIQAVLSVLAVAGPVDGRLCIGAELCQNRTLLFGGARLGLCCALPV